MKCCDLTSGMLRTTGSLQRLERAPNGSGGFDDTWTEYATPRMKVVPMSGGEKLHSNRLDATGMARVYMRYRSDIVESDKLTIEGNDHQIRSIVDIELRHKWLELMIERGVAQ